jgi:hypothetical protein
MTNDKIRALISRWRQRVEAQEHALEEVEEWKRPVWIYLNPKHLGCWPRRIRMIERCIMELEQLFD